MNISYSWLKEYIDIDLPAEEVGEILTSIGLEVGSVEEKESIPGGLRGLVTGHVVTCIDHPNSDHLHITTVDLGKELTPEDPIQIVCGAKNVAAGQNVIVATIGTTLYPVGGEPFTIKKGKIRGEESFGMICAEDEIGVGTGHEGIIVLREGIAPGTPASEIYPVHTDHIIEVDITPNRVDATSHYGVARDLYAYLKSHGRSVTLKKPEAPHITGTGSPIEVSVKSPEACFRYSGVVIKGIKVGPSPEWLRNALESIGQKSVNNIVDVSNYVLQAIGQPLHTFDYDKIAGNKVIVRLAGEGEKLTTLDGVERTLTDRDLVICDAEKPMCIAGVMGGLNSGVQADTTALFIESATFHPTFIRKTARRNGLNTDASFRYERGLDPAGVPFALDWAVELVREVADGEVAGGVCDLYPEPQEPYRVSLSLRKVSDLIGIEIPKEKILEILDALSIEVREDNGETLEVDVPRYRYDVTRDVDIIEDLLRIYGYNEVPFTTKLSSAITPKSDVDKSFSLQRVISEQLVGAGFVEILNNSLSKASYYPDEIERGEAIRLLNPLSNDLSTLRIQMVHGGLEVIDHNLKRQGANLRLFEFGNTYRRVSPEEQVPLKGFKETYTLGLWVTGDEFGPNWNKDAHKTVRPYFLSAIVGNFMSRMGISDGEIQKAYIEGDDLFDKGVELTFRGGKTFGRWGVVSERLLKTHDLDVPVYYAEFEWNTILERILDRAVTIKGVPKFPSVRRDFALLLDKNIDFAKVVEVSKKAEPKLIRDIVLFDVYEDPKHLPEGKKSYAVAFTLRDDEKTLSDKVIDKTMEKISQTLAKQLGASLR